MRCFVCGGAGALRRCVVYKKSAVGMAGVSAVGACRAADVQHPAGAALSGEPPLSAVVAEISFCNYELEMWPAQLWIFENM